MNGKYKQNLLDKKRPTLTREFNDIEMYIMGMRGNFEDIIQRSSPRKAILPGVCTQYKTRVGWENGYPEYFVKY